jgi:hypothetical protein
VEVALNAIARTAAITAIAVLALLLLVGAASHDVLMALNGGSYGKIHRNKH